VIDLSSTHSHSQLISHTKNYDSSEDTLLARDLQSYSALNHFSHCLLMQFISQQSAPKENKFSQIIIIFIMRLNDSHSVWHWLHNFIISICVSHFLSILSVSICIRNSSQSCLSKVKPMAKQMWDLLGFFFNQFRGSPRLSSLDWTAVHTDLEISSGTVHEFWPWIQFALIVALIIRI
jgi:hypothetical protein